MPRLIDQDERSAVIAAASMRVLERDGLGGLSVRGVADEAGIATASLRRAFPTQHALREHCLDIIEQRARDRIAALSTGLTGRQLAEAALSQLLPLDQERCTELTAQVQLGVLALTDTALQPAAVRLNTAVAGACRRVISILDDAGELGAGRDTDYEARRLHALLDGAAIHGLWTDDAAESLSVIVGHLDDLAKPAG